MSNNNSKILMFGLMITINRNKHPRRDISCKYIEQTLSLTHRSIGGIAVSQNLIINSGHNLYKNIYIFNKAKTCFACVLNCTTV